jgi:hypothetical protein
MTMIERTDANLIADVRLRSDLDTSLFRTDAQIRRYLNEANRQLTAKVVSFFGEGYLAKISTINTAAGTPTSAPPADCYMIRFMRVTLENDDRVNIGRTVTDDIDTDVDALGWSILGSRPTYRWEDQVIRWHPTPQAVHTVTVHYVRTYVAYNSGGTPILELSTGTDKINAYWGGDEWIVLSAAIKIKNDQEEDIRGLLAERDQLWNDISAMLSQRDEANPPKVRSSYGDPP